MHNRPKVVYAENIVRESVLIDPNVAVSSTEDTADSPNIIEEGETTSQLLRKHYGKKR
jgi:hypothetical protein